jgi:hypothetical protein
MGANNAAAMFVLNSVFAHFREADKALSNCAGEW